MIDSCLTGAKNSRKSNNIQMSGSRFGEIEERHRGNHLQGDWKEVPGWNDLYGSDVDVSDIIEY